MPLSIPDIITVAKISQYLCLMDTTKGNLFGKRLTPDTYKVIYAERKALEWMYNLDPTNSTLTLQGNYVFSLCKFNLKAQNIANTGGGGSVSPVNPSNAPSPYQFIVDASTSFIIDAQSSKIITDFIGFNLLFSRNGSPQSTVNTEVSYYSWDKATGLFTCTPAATTGELFQLFAV